MTSPTEMTDDAYRVLVNYIRDIADKVGLKDWQFFLERVEADQGVIASVEVWGDSTTCTLWFGPPFWKYGPRMQRETVVHELVHCHTHKLVRLVKTTMTNELGNQAAHAMNFSLEQMHEMAVDGIAASWARMLPCIDWSDLSPLYTEYEAQTGGQETPLRRDNVVID